MKTRISNACSASRVKPLPLTLLLIILTLFSVNIAVAQDSTEIVDGVADSLVAAAAIAFVPAPPVSVTVGDKPNDAGSAIRVVWDKSPDDTDNGKVKAYRILRAAAIDGQPGEFTEVGDVPAGKDVYESDDGNTEDGAQYFYKVVAANFFYDDNNVLQEHVAESELAGPVTSSAQWFDTRRVNTLVGTIVLVALILYYIEQAKAGKKLFIRKLAGMEAVDEAVGRATEMGKSIFYVPGISDMDNVQTIAAMSILGRVAELAASYETHLDVPVSRSMVMVTGREVVKEAYAKVGRPDAFKEDQVHYLTDDQFGYAAGVDGMVVREKPATIFYMGTFYAESLILAETGNSVGAIQIAGTAMPSQLPFFVAACDYTLIGEELFAASAYLSKEPKLLGSLKGQDYGKAIILIALLLGVVLETTGLFQLSNLFAVID